jgi:trans-aconitate methyltransferase
MREEDRQRLVGLYENRYRDLGARIETLGWKSAEDQHIRFDVLAAIADMRHATVCDVGCGFGDLLPFLTRRYGPLRYTGVDIAPSFVEEARRRHPEARFLQMDFSDELLEERFDYLLLSGALNFHVADNRGHTREVMKRMFDRCRKGVALNFLSSYVNFEREHNYHHDPADVFGMAKTLTPWVALRHDYPLWEFTVYLYRDAVRPEASQ